MSDKIIWLDLETTGLEVGMAVSDGLGDIEDMFSTPVWPGQVALDSMSDYVRAMHAKSGLLDVLGQAPGMLGARWDVQTFLDRHFGEGATDITVGGSGIDRYDLPFLRAWQVWRPVVERFHFRTIDTSAMRELMGRTGVPVPDAGTVHRALPDALWSHSVAQHAAHLFTQGANA